ncbi:MAG: hypothetical protein IPK07_05745 [Deltaproteobacteria bacterium]|nr:hypothetical protein [Deltaproteobacteria bacterium]
MKLRTFDGSLNTLRGPFKNALELAPGFARLAPVAATRSRLDTAQALASSALIAWWQFVGVRMMRQSPADDWEIARLLEVGVTVLAVLSRLTAYLDGYGPPLSVAARWKARRWVVPGFDIVFGAPRAMVLLGWWLPPLTAPVVGDELSCAFTTFLVCAIGYLAGPDRERWRLVGEHTIAVERSPSALRIEIGSTTREPSRAGPDEPRLRRPRSSRDAAATQLPVDS